MVWLDQGAYYVAIAAERSEIALIVAHLVESAREAPRHKNVIARVIPGAMDVHASVVRL